MKENLSNSSATSLFSFKLILGILVAVKFYPHFSLKYIYLSQLVNCIWSKIQALLLQYLTLYFYLHLLTPQNNDNMTKRRANTIMCALSSSIQNQGKDKANCLYHQVILLQHVHTVFKLAEELSI